MPGERFSALYVQPRHLTPDSGRARHRVGSLFREPIFNDRLDHLGAYLVRSLGVALTDTSRNPSRWHRFVQECAVADFIDTLTVVYRFLFWHVSADAANWWRDAVRKIFAEENLAYEIDDVGGVHPRIDSEFQRNLTCTLIGLQHDHYQTVRELLERASRNLGGDPPNYRQAWRATLAAMETLFALMFPHARFTAEDIDRHLAPLLRRTYRDDPTSQAAALKMLSCLQQWVEASRGFRHQPGTVQTAEPSPDLAVLSISCGASLLRWLAGIRETQAN